MKKSKNMGLLDAEYVALAEFRYQLRRFSRNMEEEVRKLGVNPQQYQVVLAVRGLPAGEAPTVTRLAERMQLNHNSMVELIDRCEHAGLLRRTRSDADRRQVILAITGRGEGLLRQSGIRWDHFSGASEIVFSPIANPDPPHSTTRRGIVHHC